MSDLKQFIDKALQERIAEEEKFLRSAIEPVAGSDDIHVDFPWSTEQIEALVELYNAVGACTGSQETENNLFDVYEKCFDLMEG